MPLPTPLISSSDDFATSTTDTTSEAPVTQSVFGYHGDSSSGKKLFKPNRGKFTSAKTKYFLGGLVLTMLMIVGGVAYNLTQKEGIGEIRQQASTAAVYTFPQTFDSGTEPQQGEWYPMSSSSAWGEGIGTNNGFYSVNQVIKYGNKPSLELVANHATGNTSAFQITYKIPVSSGVTYKVDFPVYVTENSGNGKLELLVQGQKADGKYEQPIRYSVDTSKTRQWQLISQEFTFTDNTNASDKFYVTLIAWDHRAALFGEIKVTKKTDNSLVKNLTFDSIKNSTLPTGWEFSQSNSGWTTPYASWTAGNGLAIIQSKINKTGKAIVLSSHLNASTPPSNLSQVCLPLALAPGASYPLLVDVFIPHNTGSGLVGILVQEFNSPYSHLLNFNDTVNLGLKGQWQTVQKTIVVPGTAPVGTPTSPNYKLCLQALDNRRVIFDNVNITGLVAPSNPPTSTPTPTPTTGTPTPTHTPTPPTIPSVTPSPTPTDTPPGVSSTKLNLTMTLDGVPYCEGTNCFHPALHDLTQTTGPGKQIPVQVTLQNTTSSAITKTVQFAYNETQKVYQTVDEINYENLVESPYMIVLKGPMHLATRYCYYDQAVVNRCTFSDLVNAGDITAEALAQETSFIWLGEGEYSYNLSGRPVAVGDLPIAGQENNAQDGKVNIADYSFMLSCIGQNSRTSACVTRADVDYSNQVNNIDLGLLRKTLKEVIDEL
ncbi:MAG TPA: dockerin type I repeat-containing protein [Candidatus Woesebacteria bacterium]|nr:dockerin type I repeat-containing protein [Candidatus Woesebacteria bacterium]